jgi:hypothetical protein
MESCSAGPADGQRYGGTQMQNGAFKWWSCETTFELRRSLAELSRNSIRKQMASRLPAQDKTERVDVFIGVMPTNLDLEAQLKPRIKTVHLSVHRCAAAYREDQHTWTMLCIFP